MIPPIHAAFGFLTYLLCVYFNIIPFSVFLACIAVVISMIADLDHYILYLCAKQRGYSESLLQFSATRKARSNVVHSLIGILIFSISGFLFGINVGIIQSLAYIGHIGLDCIDKEGTPALYPFTKKRFTGIIEFRSPKTALFFIILVLMNLFVLSLMNFKWY